MNGPPLRELLEHRIRQRDTLIPITCTLLGQAVSCALTFLTSVTPLVTLQVIAVAPVLQLMKLGPREALLGGHTAYNTQGFDPRLSQEDTGTCPRSHSSEG